MRTIDTHPYFENVTPINHPEIMPFVEWVFRAIEKPDHAETQDDGRIRYFIYVPEAQKYIRVITLENGRTIFNAFFDRNHKPSE